jgi:hypothetical protein
MEIGMKPLLFLSGSAIATAAALPPMMLRKRTPVNRKTDYCKCVGDYHDGECWHAA